MYMKLLLLLTLIVISVSIVRSHDGHDKKPAHQPTEKELKTDASNDTVLSGWPVIDLGTPAIRNIDYPCYVKIKLVDAESGNTVAGLVRFFTENGQRVVPQSLLPRSTGITQDHYGIAAFRRLDTWSVLIDEQTILLPRKKLFIEAFRGNKTVLSHLVIDLSDKDKSEVKVPIKKFLPKDFDDFYSGNVHLHYKEVSRSVADRLTLEVPSADDLEVVFFSYLERKGATSVSSSDKSYVSNQFTIKDLQQFSEKSGVLFGWGEEYRHNFPSMRYYGYGFGHIMLLNMNKLILPASVGPAITGSGYDDGTLFDVLVEARKRGGTTLWCHNRQGLEDIPNWIAGNLDAQIIFEGYSSDSYHDTYYRYLNIGLHVPFATGTDWFLRDLAMTYVKAPLPLSLEGWLESLKAGKSFITNGPMLNLTVNGKTVGDFVSAKENEILKIKGEGYARRDFKQLELVKNGKVIETVPTQYIDGYYFAILDMNIKVDEPAWFALRIPLFDTMHYDRPEPGYPGFNEFGMPLFAHTSAVYVRVNGKDVFIKQAAESLMAEVAWDKQTIIEHSVFSSEAESQKVQDIYNHAIETLKAAIERGSL